MKSYKDSPKSYKDFPKDVIMNAPEGAMWVSTYGHPGDCAYGYFKYSQEGGLYLTYHYDNSRWVKGIDSGLASLQAEKNPPIVPLPNVIIPWEATEDSECPVPGDTVVDAVITSPEGDRAENVRIEAGELVWKNHIEEIWVDDDFWKITSYKIIDPEYGKDSAPSATEDNKTFVDDVVSLASYVGQCDMQKEDVSSAISEIHSDVTLLHSSEYTLQQQLTQNLKFLQNLGKEFPEIQEDTLALMKKELYNYWNMTL